MDVLYIFDFDETLFSPDPLQDLKSVFTNPEHTPISSMLQLFNGLDDVDRAVITSRHPFLETRIRKMLGYPDIPIHCRPFSLPIDECIRIIQSVDLTEEFLKNTWYWKRDMYEYYAQSYKHVIVYDDHADEISKIIHANNVKVRLPLHIDLNNP